MNINNLNTNTKESEYSPKEIIRDIISIRKILPGFLNLNKDYKDIVAFFINLDLDDKNSPHKSIKGIQEKLGISYGELKKKLFQLREDIINHERLGIDFSINQIEYVFILDYFDKWERLTINHLPFVPRVGEQVWFPFFRATVGTDRFHVKKIEHHITETKQTIEITLVGGEYNLFWHLKKDEELERGNISNEEYRSTSIDSILKERFGLQQVYRFMQDK